MQQYSQLTAANITYNHLKFTKGMQNIAKVRIYAEALVKTPMSCSSFKLSCVDTKFVAQKLRNSPSIFGTQLRIQHFRWSSNQTPNGTGSESKLCCCRNNAAQIRADEVSSVDVSNELDDVSVGSGDSGSA